MKKVFIIIIFFIATVALWHFRAPADKLSEKLPDLINKVENSVIVSQIQKIQEEISAPPPLKSNRQSQNSQLTVNGVFYWTNVQRSQNSSLPDLKPNILLNKAAELKLKDLFDKQYFEHISPTGEGPADLAKSAGYAYISIGENLALGNFDNDKVLVQDWMDSPGHRANILNSKYLEIGVAVGRGIYEGQETWLAVQEFGRPAESCPSINSNLKTDLRGMQNEIDQIQPQLNELKNYLDSIKPQTREEIDAYNQKVADYNSMVKIFNNKVDTLKLLTEQYNAQVRAYNNCLGE